MGKKITILHLEDNESDALLVQLTLKKGNIDCNYFFADNKKNFIDLIENKQIDVILSDYNLPSYSGAEALEYCKINYPDIPFIFVSGTMGEEIAIESLHNGATDYVLKNHIEKLVSAIKRALHEAELAREFKKANEELQQREEQYRTLVEGMNEGLVKTDNDNIIVFANKQFCKMSGFELHELISKYGHTTLFNEKNQEIIKQKKQRRLQGTKDVYEIQLKRKDGTEIWVKINGSPLIDTNGKIIGSIAVFEDINENKIAREKLKQQRILLQSIINSVPDLIFYKDINSNFLGSNIAFDKVTGISQQERIGKTDSDFYDKEKADLFHSTDHIILENKQSQIFEEWVTLPNEDIVLYETIKTPLYDENKNIIGIVGVGRDITERKLAEEKIQLQQTLLQSIIDSVPDLIFYKDKGSVYLGCNKAFEKYAGRTQQEQVGKTDFDFFDKETAVFFRSKDQEIFEKGQTQTNEELVTYPDGHKVFLETIKTPFFNDTNEIIGLVGVSRDITERKQSENALIEGKIFTETLLNAIPVPIFYKDTIGRYIGVNKSFEMFYGMSSNELVGKTVFDIASPEFAEIYFKKDAELIQKKGTQVYESKIKNVRGEIRNVIYHKATFTDSENNIRGLIGAILDITDIRITEKLLIESQQLFKNLAQVSPVGIFRTLADGYITYVNPKWTELSGISIEEAKGYGWLKAVHPDDRKKLKENWESVIRIEKSSETEYRFLKPDGNIVWVMGNAVPEISDGKINGYIGTITDITELKIIEQDLLIAKDKAEASDRLKTAFMNNISHEIRTPLNGILGFGQMICEPGLTEEEKNHYLSILQESSDRLIKTVTEYMDISLIVSGNQKTHNQSFSIKQLINKLHINTESKCNLKNLALNPVLPSYNETIYIQTDENLLFKILDHLLDNAVKFTNTGSVSYGYKIENEYI